MTASLVEGKPEQRLPYSGRIRHYWAEAIADMAAPTVAELEGAFDFSRYIPKNGITGEPSEQFIESDDITETYEAQQVGEWGEQLTLEGYKQDPDDDFFDHFSTTKIGFWVTIWNADENSPKDGDRAYVRHIENHTAKPLPHARNEKQRCRVGTATITEPEYQATVVAGS